MKGKRLLPRSFLFFLLLLSCSDSERLFDSWPVSFVVQNTNNNEVLNAALSGMGEFCTIVDAGSQVICKNQSGKTSPISKLAVDRYGGYNFGRNNGFVVGHTTFIASRFPDKVVCYDIVCPNCYENKASAPSVQLITGMRAQCPSCQRTYDLNELGIITSGDAGRALYRYTVRYTPFQLVIGN